MLCPAGSVNARDQPLMVVVAVLVMVMVAVSPVFHALTVSVTRHVPLGGGGLLAGGGLDGGLLEGGRELAGVVGGAPVSPKNAIANAAIPLCGRLCPAPATLIA